MPLLFKQSITCYDGEDSLSDSYTVMMVKIPFKEVEVKSKPLIVHIFIHDL